MSELNRRRLSPAANVIEKFRHGDDAGVKVVAGICGVDPSQVYRWMYGKEYGGTGGSVPQRHHQTLLQEARRRSVPLTAAELIGVNEFAA